MTPEQMKVACVAFRSGQFEQLRHSIGSGKCTCAIGVCGKANGVVGKYTSDYLKGIELSDEQANLLLEWNDREELSFPQIAERIETHPLFLGALI